MLIHKVNDNTAPFLSIIIPAKNEEKFIGDCLNSLVDSLSVWGGSYEIFLVDNGSTDTTINIAGIRGCKILEAPEATISRLRNIGGEHAKGDILVFLDADCLVAPQWAALCLQKFDNQHIAIVGTRAVSHPENATWVEKSWSMLMVSSTAREGFVDWIGTSNLFIRKDVFLAVSGFDESLRTAEDVNICYRVAEKGYLIFQDKSVDTIHLRESKTLTELYRREYWRGKNSLTSFIINRFPQKELLSIVIPAINLLSLIVFVLFLVGCSQLIIVPAVIVAGFPILLLIRKRLRVKRVTVALKCYIVAFVYIFARSCALGKEILSFFKSPK